MCTEKWSLWKKNKNKSSNSIYSLPLYKIDVEAVWPIVDELSHDSHLSLQKGLLSTQTYVLKHKENGLISNGKWRNLRQSATIGGLHITHHDGISVTISDSIVYCVQNTVTNIHIS